MPIAEKHGTVVRTGRADIILREILGINTTFVCTCLFLMFFHSHAHAHTHTHTLINFCSVLEAVSHPFLFCVCVWL